MATTLQTGALAPGQTQQTGSKKAYKPNKIIKKTKEFQKYETWKPK